jgi:CheY-like chemotaxis protein/two-component sensor histidine kinase
MSHELRTPLNAILGFAQVLRLRLKPAPAGVDEQLGHVETAGWHLLELINDVLDLSRIEAGTMVVSRDAVALAPLLADSVRMVGSVAQAAQVTVLVEPCDEALAAEADATRLRQVMGNLLSNACKYNRPGGRVTVGVQAGEGLVTISVADTGAGLSAAQQAALFEPFNRLGAERGPVQGTGIGLVITKRLVELMGGTLQVQSAPGEGSVFRVVLRRSALPAAAPPAVAEPAAAPAGNRRIRLLYVEDNAANVQLLAEVLRLRPAVQLLAAVDGPQGLALAREHEPELVVVDVALPGIDGYELCRRLRALPALRQRPIVALSANAMSSDRERGRSAGFDHYFTKPLDVTNFLAWLDETLSSLPHG